MINLLPLQEKKELLAQKNQKLAAVLAYMGLAALACFALILLSLYFYVLTEVAYHREILRSAKNTYQTNDFLSYKNIISQSNQALLKLDNFYKKEVRFSGALKTVSDIPKPADLRVTDITMEPGTKNAIKMGIGGVADSRESLLAFKDSIQQQKSVTNVYFPPDNWIKPKDINFYLTLEVMPPNGP